MTKRKLFYIILFIVIYGVLVSGTMLYENRLEIQLTTFDLNNDGVFSTEEQTSEQQELMDRWTNDLGRNLMPLYALFISLAGTLLVFAGEKTYVSVFRRKESIESSGTNQQELS